MQSESKKKRPDDPHLAEGQQSSTCFSSERGLLPMLTHPLTPSQVESRDAQAPRSSFARHKNLFLSAAPQSVAAVSHFFSSQLASRPCLLSDSDTSQRTEHARAPCQGSCHDGPRR